MAVVMTVRDFAREILTDLGALQQGETPNASETLYVLTRLNTLVDQWKAEGLSFYTLRNNTYALTPAEDEYTLGTGGSLAGSTRPARIRNAAAIVSGFSHPVEVITNDQYNLILEKDEQARSPRQLYCDYAYPLAHIFVWPVPLGACNLQLFTWEPIPSFANEDAQIDLPPAYMEALRTNVAIRVGPGFEAKVDPLIAAAAVESKQAMQKYNAETLGIVVTPPQATPAQ